MRPVFLILVYLYICKAADAQFQVSFDAPKKGFTSWQPASNWENGLLSGNGTVGAIVMGQPHDETIILSHALLYLPLKRSPKLINQGQHLNEIRQLLLQGKNSEAATIPVALRQEEGYNDARDPFIPAFDVRVEQEPSNISKYQRSVNYETGEAIVKWQDKKGVFERRVFCSRADSIIVVSIRGSSKINCTLQFQRRPVEWNQWNFINEHIDKAETTAESEQWLQYSSSFKIKNEGSISGYEGVGKVIAVNGTVKQQGSSLIIKDASEVLLVIKIHPVYNDNYSLSQLKNSLNDLPVNYAELLSKHIAIHKELFNRVSLYLNASKDESLLNTEELLLQAKKNVTAAVVQKAFDAGRYNIISATGINPPNLQGIWTGTWIAPWTGGMTNDGNLPTAISINLPGNTPELLHAYFNYHEKLMNDYRAAAKALYNTRGIHIPAQETTTGLDTDFGETWCLTFWTGAAGWAASYFWDYYQYTLDKTFLKEHAYPFMKEAALFYEDFLSPGKDGKYVFNPSYSPENNPANNSSQAAINATMDVMIAKQLLSNCIKAAKLLSIDGEKITQWSSMSTRMPAYEISAEGALKEWIWKDVKENFNHRHASQLYALYNEVEPVFQSSSALKDAAAKVIEEKMKFRAREGGGEMAFGLVQLGVSAAHLQNKEQAHKIVDWLSSKYWSTGMGSFHNVGNLFNTDISGGLPYLVSQMLVYSKVGFISLFPALPVEWKKGSIKGLLLRGNIHLNELKWDDKHITLSLQSPVTQQVDLVLPFAVKPIEAKGSKTPNALKTKNHYISLYANKEFVIEFLR